MGSRVAGLFSVFYIKPRGPPGDATRGESCESGFGGSLNGSPSTSLRSLSKKRRPIEGKADPLCLLSFSLHDKTQDRQSDVTREKSGKSSPGSRNGAGTCAAGGRRARLKSESKSESRTARRVGTAAWEHKMAGGGGGLNRGRGAPGQTNQVKNTFTLNPRGNPCVPNSFDCDNVH